MKTSSTQTRRVRAKRYNRPTTVRFTSQQEVDLKAQAQNEDCDVADVIRKRCFPKKAR